MRLNTFLFLISKKSLVNFSDVLDILCLGVGISFLYELSAHSHSNGRGAFNIMNLS